MRADWDRAIPVTSDVGSRLAMPASPASAPPPLTPSRFSRMIFWIARKRSTGSIGYAGTEMRVGVKALPPMSRSVRVLTTKLVFSDASATPRASW